MAIYKVKRKKGHKYVARIYLATADGKRKEINKTFNTEREAKEFSSKTFNFKNNKQNLEVSDKVLLLEVFNKYFEKLEREKTKYNTIKNYKSMYRTWVHEKIGYFQIGNISHLTLIRFIEEIKREGIGESSLYLVGVILSNLFDFASNSIERYVVENPMRHITIPEPESQPISKDDFYDKEEIEKILNAAINSEYYDFLIFALNTGLRVSELSGLTTSNLDTANKLITVNNKLTKYSGKDSSIGSTYIIERPKSNKTRIVPLNGNALEAIKRAVKYSKDNHFIFYTNKTALKKVVTGTGQKIKTIEARFLGPKTVYSFMENLAIKAGVKRLGPHGLRHTFSAHYLMNGGDIFTLSKILGHASVNTTIRSYGHLSKEYLANAINIVSFGGKK